MSNQESFDSIIDRYNAGVEPLENWTTADIVSAIRLLDAELQARYDEEKSSREREPGEDDDLGEEDEYDFEDWELFDGEKEDGESI